MMPLFSIVWYEMHRRASTTPGAGNAAVGHASMHRVHFPQRSPTAPGSARPVSGGSGASSRRVRMDAMKSQFPCVREISIEFFPTKPAPERAAQALSRTGPVST